MQEERQQKRRKERREEGGGPKDLKRGGREDLLLLHSVIAGLPFERRILDGGQLQIHTCMRSSCLVV